MTYRRYLSYMTQMIYFVYYSVIRQTYPNVSEIAGNIIYNQNGDLLDIYKSGSHKGSKKLPVFVFIHGGGWVFNKLTSDYGIKKNILHTASICNSRIWMDSSDSWI